MKRALLLFLLLSIGPAQASPIRWVEWSPEVFAQAKAEHKLVILDLEAVWCHWCHVMDKETYHDGEVARLIRKGFIAVRVDQDARPDLSNRYEDYGWPATVIYNSDGQEIVKMSGYIPPLRMRSLLAACIEDPTPGPSVTGQAISDDLPPASGLKARLAAHLDARADRDLGGWSTIHKYLDWDAAEACLRRGDPASVAMARKTLDAQLGLIDPVWGGVYQYSDSGVWNHPHFEKIMAMQAEDMRLYALAWSAFGDRRYRHAAEAVHRFLRAFLTSPQGAFYASQDADVVQGEHSAEYFALDDAGRRARGVPRVDRHLYARENGLAIRGLCALYAATGDRAALAEAERAARWTEIHRALPGGGFRHGEKDSAGPYLGDTLAMGRAFLSLYEVTANRSWLGRAEAAADFIARHFAGEGFKTAGGDGRAQVDENIGVARFANLLWHYDGRSADRQVALRARAFLEKPEMAARNDGGVYLVLDELDRDPLHVTVVGPKSDAGAAALYAAALRCRSGYRRIEWLDFAEGPLPNNALDFPKGRAAAAYLCTDTRCSLPITSPARLLEKLAR
jgi:uncharacterized protein YyaL (SSP411 family)